MKAILYGGPLAAVRHTDSVTISTRALWVEIATYGFGGNWLYRRINPLFYIWQPVDDRVHYDLEDA